MSTAIYNKTRLGLKQTRWFNTMFGYSVLSVLVLVFMIPLYWMISTALKTPQQTFAIPPEWVPLSDGYDPWEE